MAGMWKTTGERRAETPEESSAILHFEGGNENVMEY